MTYTRTGSRGSYEAVSYAQLPHWGADQHAMALLAFSRTFAALDSSANTIAIRAIKEAEADGPRIECSDELQEICGEAISLINRGSVSDTEARLFFEQRFVPHRRVCGDAGRSDTNGFLTGYYEPVLKGSRRKTADFRVALLRRPPDLVNLVDEALRGAESTRFTHARKLPDGTTQPYAARREIENGHLDALGLAFLYVADPVDAYFMHVQGSGLIELEGGEPLRIGYDGKNGHPYTSIGQHVIGLGEIDEAEMTLDRLKSWLRADPVRGQQTMWLNASYIFFKELGPASSALPLGVRDIPLTEGRSLAVDAAWHGLGLPIFVSAPELAHACQCAQGFHRLMVAQDAGSAIRGPERGDIFFGTGEAAGVLAGKTRHAGMFHVLLPRQACNGRAS